MAKTNWKMGDTVQPADLNQIGEEINKNTADIENIQQELEHLDLSAENVTLDSPDFQSKNVKDGMQELFTSVSDGKTQLETAITDKDGTVSKQGDVATFNELDAGIRSIPQAKGNATRADVLASKTFSSEVAGIEQTGTMVNRTGHVNAQSISRSGTALRLRPQQGYYGGESGNSVQISHSTIAPENIKAGVNFAGSGLLGSFSGEKQPSHWSEAYRIFAISDVNQILNSTSRKSSWWNDDGTVYVAEVTLEKATLTLYSLSGSVLSVQSYTPAVTRQGCILANNRIFYRASADEYHLYDFSGNLIRTFPVNTIENTTTFTADICLLGNDDILLLKYSGAVVYIVNSSGSILHTIENSNMTVEYLRFINSNLAVCSYNAISYFMRISGSLVWRYASSVSTAGMANLLTIYGKR